MRTLACSQWNQQRVRSTVLPFGIFLIIGFVLLPFYRYELDPDTISYLSIAEQYVAGYWKEAINAYWGPLYSWCVALPLSLHVPAAVALKAVDLGAGILALFALQRFSASREISAGMRNTVLWVGVPIVLGFAMEANTPDLLFTALLLLYLGITFDPKYPSFAGSGIVCGLLGALAYLAKSYGFFFFTGHFLLFSAIAWGKEMDSHRRRRIAQHSLGGLAIFYLTSFAWMAGLHAKYGKWMLGTAGDFNYRLVGPESSGYPHFRHLLSPTSEHATTAWQDPSPAWLPPWSAFTSRADFTHQAKLVFKNTKDVLKFWLYIAPLFPLFLVAYPLLCLTSPSKNTEWRFLMLTIVLFSSGYLFVTAQYRYFWLTGLLLLWIAFRTLDLAFQKFALAAPLRLVVISATVLSFLLAPVRTLRGQFLRDRDLYSWSETIRRSLHVRGRLASCGNWNDSAYLAYVLRMPYYGVATPEADADEVARELNPDYRASRHPIDRKQISSELSGAQIDYFIEWPSCGPESLQPYSTVAQAGDIKLTRAHQANGNLPK